MVDDAFLKCVAEAHREDRNAKKRLLELVGDFATRTHTTADVLKLMDMVAFQAEKGRPEAGEADQAKERVKYVRGLVSQILQTQPLLNDMTWTTLGRVEALLLNEEEQ